MKLIQHSRVQWEGVTLALIEGVAGEFVKPAIAPGEFLDSSWEVGDGASIRA